MSPEYISAKRVGSMPPDQSARYVWALERIPWGAKVLDAGCGCGHGTYLLGMKAKSILGIDRRPEALGYAGVNYTRPDGRVKYVLWEWDKERVPSAPEPGWDAIVAFEFLEHINRVVGFLQQAYNVAQPGGRLLLSAPHPSWRAGGTQNPFHKRVFDPTELVSLACGAGWHVVEMRYQMIDWRLGFLRPNEIQNRSMRCTCLLCTK